MSATGVEDSPIANRGCFPFSSKQTLKPDFSNANAVREPAKPAPAIKIS